MPWWESKKLMAINGGIVDKTCWTEPRQGKVTIVYGDCKGTSCWREPKVGVLRSEWAMETVESKQWNGLGRVASEEQEHRSE